MNLGFVALSFFGLGGLKALTKTGKIVDAAFDANKLARKAVALGAKGDDVAGVVNKLADAGITSTVKGAEVLEKLALNSDEAVGIAQRLLGNSAQGLTKDVLISTAKESVSEGLNLIAKISSASTSSLSAGLSSV